MEIDFLRPPVVGDRLGRRGGVLKACVPKWTTVGRGAFMTLEAEVITETGEVVARVRNTVFAYEPVGPPSAVVGAERDAS
jgi:acyl dehydratase